MTENWNRALAAARGALVAKLDADDAWRPELLATLRAELRRDTGGGAPPLVAFCRAVECDEALSPTAAWHGEAALASAGFDLGVRFAGHGRDLWRLSVGEHQLWQSSAFLVRREDLLALGGFDARWSCAADTAMLLRLFAEERAVAHHPYVGVLYRRRLGSVSATFELGGWKTFEGLLVRLDAFTRNVGRLAPLDRTLRQRWWQIWRAMVEEAGRGELWASMPARVRAKLESARRSARPPSAAVRAEGWLRLQAWRARARMRSVRSPTVRAR